MFDFFKKLFNMNRMCPDCQGRGRWQDLIDDGGGMQHMDTHYCESCHGTGVVTSDDDTDDFDLGGVGVTEFDDDEQD